MRRTVAQNCFYPVVSFPSLKIKLRGEEYVFGLRAKKMNFSYKYLFDNPIGHKRGENPLSFINWMRCSALTRDAHLLFFYTISGKPIPDIKERKKNIKAFAELLKKTSAFGGKMKLIAEEVLKYSIYIGDKALEEHYESTILWPLVVSAAKEQNDLFLKISKTI